MVVGFGITSVLRTGVWLASILVGMIVLYLIFVVWGRRRSRRNLVASGGSLPAQLPVRVARQRGASIRPRLRDTAQLLGRLSISEYRVEWLPGKGAKKVGAIPVRWSRTPETKLGVVRLGGPIPLSVLHVEDQFGTADIWVRRSVEVLAGGS